MRRAARHGVPASIRWSDFSSPNVYAIGMLMTLPACCSAQLAARSAAVRRSCSRTPTAGSNASRRRHCNQDRQSHRHRDRKPLHLSGAPPQMSFEDLPQLRHLPPSPISPARERIVFGVITSFKLYREGIDVTANLPMAVD